MYTANEGPVRIQYKCLVSIYVFPEMKLLFPKQNYNVLSPSPYTTLIYLWEIYIFPGSVCLCCCREICGPFLGIYKSLKDTGMWNLGLRPQFPEKEYMNGIFLVVYPMSSPALHYPALFSALHSPFLCSPSLYPYSFLTAKFAWIFKCSTLLHLPSLGFHCDRECWNRTHDCMLRLWRWQSDALTARLDLIHIQFRPP